MEITVTYLIKDKFYMLEDQLDYHSKIGAQSFYMYLINSDSKTISKVKELSKNHRKLYYKILDSDVFNEENYRTEIAKEAYKEFKSDWIISNDEDEFWFIKDGNLQSFFSEVETEGYNAVYLNRYNMLPFTNTDLRYTSPLRTYTYLVSSPLNLDKDKKGSYNISPKEYVTRKISGKTAFKPKDVIWVEAGSHVVKLNNKKVFTSNENFIVHYPFSSLENTIKELSERSNIFAYKSTLTQGQAWHANFIEHLKQKDLFEDFIRQIYSKNSIGLSELIKLKIVTEVASLKNHLEL